MVVSQPSANPALSAEYSLGAQLSYRKHGVHCALDVEALHSGADTVMFLAVINRAGRMVAGVRAKGPLRSADDSHAVVEWRDTRPASRTRDDQRPVAVRHFGDEDRLGTL